MIITIPNELFKLKNIFLELVSPDYNAFAFLREGQAVEEVPEMDKKEAQQLLGEFIADLQSRSYQDWQGLIGESMVVEKKGPSGVTYQIEWNAFWDSPAGGDIRVMVSIDDGSLARFIVPLTTSFLVSPAG